MYFKLDAFEDSSIQNGKITLKVFEGYLISFIIFYKLFYKIIAPRISTIFGILDSLENYRFEKVWITESSTKTMELMRIRSIFLLTINLLRIW